MKNKGRQIDSATMKKFIEIAAHQLEGEWVVIGGTVLPLMNIDLRVTVDIDLVNLDAKNSNLNSLKLMEIAESMGLPVETINQSGAYFLSKIEDAQEHLVLFKESKKCKIYRPDVYLFLKLKLTRLSQSDFEDCVAFVKKNPDEVEKFKKQISALFKSSLKNTSPEKRERLIRLMEAVGGGK